MKILFEQALSISAPWLITDMSFDEKGSRLDIHLDFGRGSRFADEDGVLCPVHDTVDKTWRHLNFFQHECYLHARVPRIKRDDGKVKQITPDWSGKLSGFTLLFEVLLLQLAIAMPVSKVSQLVGVSEYKIWAMLDKYVEQALAEQDLSTVDAVGIDETSIARGYSYISLFVDLQQRRTIHVSEGKSSNTVSDFVEHLEKQNGKAEQVKEVSCDMSPAFIKGVSESLPKAQITFDKFHIIKLINEAVDKVRRAEVKDNPLLKGSRYALLKNDENLTKKQAETKANLSKLNLKTLRAVNMRETFQQLYLLPDLITFEQALRRWYYWATHSRLPAMIKVAKTIRNHWDGVLHWVESKINNGILEGLNSILQAAKRKARGYKAKHFKTMTFLLTGKLDFTTQNPYLPTRI